MKNLFLLIFFFIGISCLAGCESPPGDGPHQLPYQMKFDLADVGAKYEFRVRVEKPAEYAISVDFYVRNRNEYSHFLDRKETREESARLFNMMGTQRDPDTREWSEIGAPATFRVQLVQDTSRHHLIDRLITRPRTMGTYMGRTAKLAKHLLIPGTYTVRVTYIDGICELSPLIGSISFYNTTPPK